MCPREEVAAEYYEVVGTKGGNVLVLCRITFNENYPEKPPRIRFTTEIFHPNVYS